MSDLITQATEINATLYIFAEAKPDWELRNLEPGDVPYDFHVRDFDYGSEKSVRLCEYDITVPVPEGIDIRQACIDNLREQMEKVKAEKTKELNDLQERIDNLQYLTYQPEE